MARALSHDIFGDDLRITRFSDCRKYRYYLEVTWDVMLPKLVFLMLNPSTADEQANDPTVERCERRARALGYGSVIILNLFAYRATDPSDMKAVDDPIGPDNDLVIDCTVRATIAHEGTIVCAWGNHGTHLGRAAAVRAAIEDLGAIPMAVACNKNGEPGHPLYVPYEQQPRPLSEFIA